MSLSISRHSEGSITYCDEVESGNDLTQETKTLPEASQPRRRHTSFAFGEHHLETSTPKARFSDLQFLGKENDFRSVRTENLLEKRRRSRVLDTLYSDNQLLMRDAEKSATSQKTKRTRKNAKRATMSFEIYRPCDGNLKENSCHDPEQFETSIRRQHKSQEFVGGGLPSPEYDPGSFLGTIKLENESHCQTATIDSVVSNNEQAMQLAEMFPNANPEFLKLESKRMNAPLGDVIDSILSKMEKNQIPTKEDGKKHQEVDTNTNKFSVDQLLKLVPDPWTYFSDKGRDCSGYSDHSLHYLKTKFRKFYNQTITDALLFHNQNLYLAWKYLNKKNRGLKLRMTNRPLSECNACKPDTVNLQFLLEVAFIEHEEEVRNYLKTQKAAKKFRLKEATRLGLLVECECCYEENLLPEDVVSCNAGHTFCKECIARYIETGIGNRTNPVQCLAPCNEEYPLQVIQDLLRPEIFSKLMETTQPSEVADLAQCPFCHYMMFLPADSTVVTCLNVKCLKESCRVCKSSTHEPMKCEVIPTSVNDRQVWCCQCKKKVIKEEECNEMVCSCGGRTCYVCKQPVRDHSHFFLYKDEDDAKCPFYSIEY